jgi:hypothetical protein
MTDRTAIQKDAASILKNLRSKLERIRFARLTSRNRYVPHGASQNSLRQRRLVSGTKSVPNQEQGEDASRDNQTAKHKKKVLPPDHVRLLWLTAP